MSGQEEAHVFMAETSTCSWLYWDTPLSWPVQTQSLYCILIAIPDIYMLKPSVTHTHTTWRVCVCGGWELGSVNLQSAAVVLRASNIWNVGWIGKIWGQNCNGAFSLRRKKQPRELNAAPVTWIKEERGRRDHKETGRKKGSRRETGSVSFVQHYNLGRWIASVSSRGSFIISPPQWNLYLQSENQTWCQSPCDRWWIWLSARFSFYTSLIHRSDWLRKSLLFRHKSAPRHTCVREHTTPQQQASPQQVGHRISSVSDRKFSNNVIADFHAAPVCNSEIIQMVKLAPPFVSPSSSATCNPAFCFSLFSGFSLSLSLSTPAAWLFQVNWRKRRREETLHDSKNKTKKTVSEGAAVKQIMQYLN